VCNAQWEEFTKKLASNEEELKFLEVKCENLRVAEAMISAQVNKMCRN
jgi:hypothetical protein